MREGVTKVNIVNHKHLCYMIDHSHHHDHHDCHRPFSILIELLVSCVERKLIQEDPNSFIILSYPFISYPLKVKHILSQEALVSSSKLMKNGSTTSPSVSCRLQVSRRRRSSRQWGYPNSWMVYFMENPMRNRMKPMKILNMI